MNLQQQAQCTRSPKSPLPNFTQTLLTASTSAFLACRFFFFWSSRYKICFINLILAVRGSWVSVWNDDDIVVYDLACLSSVCNFLHVWIKLWMLHALHLYTIHPPCGGGEIFWVLVFKYIEFAWLLLQSTTWAWAGCHCWRVSMPSVKSCTHHCTVSCSNSTLWRVSKTKITVRHLGFITVLIIFILIMHWCLCTHSNHRWLLFRKCDYRLVV